jgi:hypothetical protein
LAEAASSGRPGSQLRAAQMFLLIGTVAMGLLSLVFMTSAIGAWFLDHRVLATDAERLSILASFAAMSLSGFGSYAGVMSILHLRDRRLAKAFRWALLAAFLPPVEIFALAAAMAIYYSPEATGARTAEAARRRGHSAVARPAASLRPAASATPRKGQ